MGLVKYYKLETDNEAVVGQIDGVLQKHLLDTKHLSTPLLPPHASDAGQGSDSSDIYDNGEFEILYQDTNIERVRKWFKDRLKRAKIELVIRANSDDLRYLQEAFAQNNVKVIDAKSVESGVYSFTTLPAHPGCLTSSKDLIEEYIRTRCSSHTTVTVKMNENVQWDGAGGTGFNTFQGYVSGPIVEVCKSRQWIKSALPSFGTPIKLDSINFL